MVDKTTLSYQPFSRKAALELASPPTWVAALAPVGIAGTLALVCALYTQMALAGLAVGNPETLGLFTGGLLAYAPSASYPWLFPSSVSGTFLSVPLVVLGWRSAVCWLLMALCAVLAQSAANTLNDYQDFKKGLDSAQTILDETDASIVYNRINPRQALYFALSCLMAAALCGVGVVVLSDPVLLVWGLVAAMILVLYSLGPKPLSYLPLGELASGLVMGGIITAATFYAMTLSMAALVLAVAVVPTLGIAMIMLTNNTCDIQRDRNVGRRTLPIVLGLSAARLLNASLGWFLLAWMFVLLLVQAWYWGLLALPVYLVLCLGRLRRLRQGPYDLGHRCLMMGTVVSLNRRICLCLCLALLMGGLGSAF